MCHTLVRVVRLTGVHRPLHLLVSYHGAAPACCLVMSSACCVCPVMAHMAQLLLAALLSVLPVVCALSWGSSCCFLGVPKLLKKTALCCIQVSMQSYLLAFLPAGTVQRVQVMRLPALKQVSRGNSVQCTDDQNSLCITICATIFALLNRILQHICYFNRSLPSSYCHAPCSDAG